ncbi:MAG: sel1 repeat family protein [Aliivibrio sp.]|uniref:tetratricopeptide repeat protein n=1 Tax=Aliivibrio sp. TaxID=1872443 RepID=UPI001A4EB8BD|nr:sel1 repeat family protein [Aliivibrio sp.]
MGNAYARGVGISQDYKVAAKWYTLAAEQGYANAQGFLGWLHASGNGVLKNYTHAHMWGNIASANGDEFGGKLRDEIEKMMTSSDISTAQRLASECIKKEYKYCG